jgi:hypothetical protein
MMMRIGEFANVQKFKVHHSDKTTDDVRIRELQWLAPYIPNWGLNIELGVFKGTTISCLAEARPDLEFHGFDSFEGLPEDWDCGTKYVEGKAFDREGVMPNVPDNVKLYKGWFEDTLPPFLDEQSSSISFLHVDCDIYSSTAYALTELDSRIIPGTIIRFDELACWRSAFGEATPQGEARRALYTTWEEHEWKALNEWMEKCNRKVVPLSRNWFQGATVVVTQ